MTAPAIGCRRCGTSLAGKRRDAKFCSDVCRVGSHRHEVGRVESIRADVIIDRPLRDAMIEIGELNMQDEHDPQKVREAFARMCRKVATRFA
ncbi:hypothetical protein [Mesorhizobium sp.]|uniref:hypothetical protein n=1 Tax=Mesorhizobium sp. TaxID=1871066 RepID=UPI000FD24BC2|nr:hypothetical protein [Mesorhizobium sp.]RVC57686.1 hypothetical protein EN779_21115 [Mesorhizobium sp. M4B.F.Ca.ET.088.02.2.1]RWF32424.1 MAG: hypothetical protein EOS45_06815 [Mesorhizobium sp.]